MRTPYKFVDDPWTKVCSSDNWTYSSLYFSSERKELTNEFNYQTVCLYILSGILNKATNMLTIDCANKYLLKAFLINNHIIKYKLVKFKGSDYMNVTYIHHSGFLVETDHFYYLFDYEKGDLPILDNEKPIYVLSSHSHGDHYNKNIFSILKSKKMKYIKAILSDDIEIPEDVDTLSVSPYNSYELSKHIKLTTFKSTDLGVAFLIEDNDKIIYHAGDLNDWVWDDESDFYNQQMTIDYHHEINLLSKHLNNKAIDVAFVVLDPRQEQDYARGICYFMENISSKYVYPMHFWDQEDIIYQFLHEYPQYVHQIQKTI